MMALDAIMGGYFNELLKAKKKRKKWTKDFGYALFVLCM